MNLQTLITCWVFCAFLPGPPAWGQSPFQELSDQGIDLSISITADHSKNFQGGLSTHQSAFRHLFDVNATLDMEKLAGAKGGTLYLDFYNQHGQDGSARLVGDLQAFSNIDADGRTQLAEVWYLQTLEQTPVSIKFGKIDANGDFAAVEHGSEFIHSSPGFSPTIVSFPSYPDPAFATVLLIEASDTTYLNLGLFDGSLQEGVPTGSRGPKSATHAPGDLFWIGEAGFHWDDFQNMGPGRMGFGLWHHTGSFTAFDGSMHQGTTGFYLTLDQQLFKENPNDEQDEQGSGLFAQYGYADAKLSSIEHHFGVGVQCVGLYPGRDDDVAGAMISWAELSHDASAGFVDEAEIAIEWFYKCVLGPNISLKPDLQYIINPGGNGSPNALVGTVRLEVGF